MLDDNYICYKTIAPLYVLCCYNCTLFNDRIVSFASMNQLGYL